MSEGRLREEDLGLKKMYYAKKGIAKYMSIDRDEVTESRRGSYAPDQRVIVCKLNDKRLYEGREYRGTEEVRSRFFDSITAKEMLWTPCPSGELREKVRNLKTNQAEIIRRKDEELRLEKQERKKEEEMRRKADEELRLERQKSRKEKEEMLREIERLRGKGRKQSDNDVKKGKEKRHKPEGSGGTARRRSAAGEHSKKGNRSCRLEDLSYRGVRSLEALSRWFLWPSLTCYQLLRHLFFAWAQLSAIGACCASADVDGPRDVI